MSKKEAFKPNYWSVYKAINFKGFSKNNQFVDKNTGKKVSYTFFGAEEIRNSFFLSFFSGILWISPAMLIVLLTVLFGGGCILHYIFGALAVIAYHFAGMYYCIRGPIIQFTQEKKKGFFGK